MRVSSIHSPARDRADRMADHLAVARDRLAIGEVDEGHLVALRDVGRQHETAGKCRAGGQAEIVHDDRDVVARVDPDVAGRVPRRRRMHNLLLCSARPPRSRRRSEHAGSRRKRNLVSPRFENDAGQDCRAAGASDSNQTCHRSILFAYRLRMRAGADSAKCAVPRPRFIVVACKDVWTLAAAMARSMFTGSGP